MTRPPRSDAPPLLSFAEAWGRIEVALAPLSPVQPPLAEALRHDPDRTEFQRAVVESRPEGPVARGAGPQGSSRLLSLAGANALRCEKEHLVFRRGEGGEPHRQVGGHLLGNQRIYDWLDERLAAP